MEERIKELEERLKEVTDAYWAGKDKYEQMLLQCTKCTRKPLVCPDSFAYGLVTGALIPSILLLDGHSPVTWILSGLLCGWTFTFLVRSWYRKAFPKIKSR